jgi:nitroimidazol reductase NimA-like FMN-containing flavoprotein (pyridoxamine 5'-phosphate oxidase superfamily)
MLISEISEKDCHDVLGRAFLARLGCARNDQPYVIPVGFAYEGDYLYVFATFGKKIEWMRDNPKVCLQVDEINGRADWTSVIVNGVYEELPEPRFTDERSHARKLLEKRHQWWLNALAERRTQLPDGAIAPIFFRVHIDSISGLRGEEEKG